MNRAQPRASYRPKRRPAWARLDTQALLDALDMPSALIDQRGTVLAVNAAWSSFGAANGATASSLGTNYLSICDAATGGDVESARTVAERMRALLAGSIASFSYEYPCPTVDGQRWYIIHAARISCGGAVYALLRHEDTTRHRLTERSLHDSERRYRMVWAANNDALALSDPDGIVLDANPAYYQLYGGTPAEVIGMSFARIFPPEQRAIAEQQYRATFADQPEGMLFEAEVLGADGERHVVESRIDFISEDGRRLAMLSVVRDITERKRAEAALQELQRLESIGLLAGGIAHDFNNLLTGVQGYTELALSRLPPGHVARPDLTQALGGIRHVTELTMQLLAYAGRGAPNIALLDLNTVIGEVAGLLRVPAQRAGGVTYRLAPRLPPIEGDVTQIRQVVLNLITNALDAVGEGAGGVVVSTGVAELEAAALKAMAHGSDLPPGRYVALSVADAGHGMDAATLRRIFEPFFSTRAFGRGMGLAAVHGIIRRHSAALAVQSQPGEGTTMQVYFPALSGAAAGPEQAPKEVEVQASQGVCLVIDDEAAVRAVAARMLEHLGYRVVYAEDGAAGLAMLRAGIEGLVAALVDLTMPSLLGDEVVRAIKEHNPQLWVVLMSGYSTTALAEGRAELGPDAYLQKPFTMAALRSALSAG